MQWENVAVSLLITAGAAALAHRAGITTRTKMGPLPGLVVGVAIPLVIGTLFFGLQTVVWWQSTLWMTLAFLAEAIAGEVCYLLEGGYHKAPDAAAWAEQKLGGGSELQPDSHFDDPFPISKNQKR